MSTKVCVHVCQCTMCCVHYPQRPEEDVRSPTTGIIKRFQSTILVLGMEPSSSERVDNALKIPEPSSQLQWIGFQTKIPGFLSQAPCVLAAFLIKVLTSLAGVTWRSLKSWECCSERSPG